MLTIIGCGNTNRSDDGVGVYVAQQLLRWLQTNPQSAVRVFDAGTGGMEVMFQARGATRLIIIDASQSGSVPGAIYQVPGEELIGDREPSYSLPDFRWDHALYAGRRIFREDFPQDGAARIQDAIQAYHHALRTFTKDSFPSEFAILHNNLAIAYLAIPMSDERAKMREALAVQSFEEVLKVINIVDHPTEYAMIQNNLGNALQYAASGHAIENNIRALEAYDEALKVRTRRDTPMEYANTIANKANVLRNLPDDASNPLSGNIESLKNAQNLYREAYKIFQDFGQSGSAEIVAETIGEIEYELNAKIG